MIYEIVYRIKGYTLADAFRPNPFWGKRIFRVDTEKLGTEDEDAIRQAAIETAPDRHEFFSIKLLPGSVPKVAALARKDAQPVNNSNEKEKA